MTRTKSSGQSKKKQSRAPRKDRDEPEIITTYTERDLRRVEELIEKHGWERLREKK